MKSNENHGDNIGCFSGACYVVNLPEQGDGPVCGPAFFTTEPIDPELFDDRGPAGQVLAASKPMHDVYLAPQQDQEHTSQDDAHPVHLLSWDLLTGVLFFASGKPPVSCR